jgi:Bacteriophytochrome (light-regulated signal transduction histidine kinase)
MVEKRFEKGDNTVLRATYELQAIHKEGKQFPIEFVVFKIKEDLDYLFCAFVRDISEHKRMNEELERIVGERTERLTQSNEELKQFAKIASHDLQEPLRAVQGFANLLKETTEGKLDDEAQEFIAFILDGTQRMQNLIQAVLTHSSIIKTEGTSYETKCNDVIEDVLTNLSALIKETEAGFDIDSLPEVAVERSHLVQLFQNLISNALKYRNKTRPPHIEIKVDSSGDYWLFSVRDNGIGMDPRYTEKVFDMFARLHGKNEYSGTGMGLAICKRIVTSHGGSISVESQPGEGSIFLFTLPAVTKPKERFNERKD